MRMRDRSKFAALILTHGRPDKVITYKTLRKCGYTGRIVIVIDDEDPTADEYRQRYGDEVVQFSKSEAVKGTDVGDNQGKRGLVVYARNASFAIARDLGLDYFVQLDDDYSNFSHRSRVPDATEDWELRQLRASSIRNMDEVVASMLSLLEDTGALTVAFAQGGEMIGGVASHVARLGWKRKAMNSFFVRTDRPVTFMGATNEDVSSYCVLGSRGEVFMTVSQASLSQTQTQQQRGGLTEEYLDSGTYVKSFYTVMMCPSFVSVRSIGMSERRIHHHIDWPHAVPKILAPEFRKDG
jgi:hypothetical protein